MARKVILDVDPGVSDALAICLALAHPDLEVVAVTATGGNVAPRQASRNVQAIIEHLDPPRWPRIGVADEEQPLRTDGRELWGFPKKLASPKLRREIHRICTARVDGRNSMDDRKAMLDAVLDLDRRETSANDDLAARILAARADANVVRPQFGAQRATWMQAAASRA